MRNNSAFLIKRNGLQLTTEPFNLTSTNSFKASGLANEKAVDLSWAKDSKDKLKIQFSVKSASKKNQPKAASSKIFLSKGFRRCANSVKKATGARSYRSDMEALALQRYTAMTRSLKRKTDVVGKKRRNRNL